MVGAELLERTAAQQFIAFPCSPECDGRMPQSHHIKRVHTFWWRVPVHRMQMRLQQSLYRTALQIVDAYFHCDQNKK